MDHGLVLKWFVGDAARNVLCFNVAVAFGLLGG